MAETFRALELQGSSLLDSGECACSEKVNLKNARDKLAIPSLPESLVHTPLIVNVSDRKKL